MYKPKTIKELYSFIRAITLTRQRLLSTYGTFEHHEGKNKTWLILCNTEQDFAFMEPPMIYKSIVIPKYASVKNT